MALSCTRLCSRLALVRLGGARASGTPNTFLSQQTSCEPRFPLCRNYSASKVRHGFSRHVGSKLQKLNCRYEGFLKRRFPRFFGLYHTFVEGFKLLYRDAKDVRMIKSKMISDGVSFQELSYRDMEKLRQFRRNVIKAIPLMLISIPPFANYLVFVLMYYYPRQVLIPHFWTPSQQVAFRGVYHGLRVEHHMPLLQGMQNTSSLVQEGQLHNRLQHLCAKVQKGKNPTVSEILAVRGLFSGSPLGMRMLSVDHMRRLSALLFLTSRLPGFLIGRRLNSHAQELLLLDRALSRLGPQQLDDFEVRQACFIRGINPDGLSGGQCREWLSQWLQVSSSLKESEVSLLLHSLVFLSANYPKGPGQP